ncbi:MAG: FAD-binding oxidoreductase, partial [Micromonosporaceae bacterium]|nr:FAD-binding oxidoreductase [Micromonosporaceae bacterium]
MVDVAVVGAGIVGAACADQLTAAGLSVTVLERGALAGGTTGAGEGNILVSDKEPGPELSLALWSRRLWSELDLPGAHLEPKGGLVVAYTEAELAALGGFAAAQRPAGVVAEALRPEQAGEAEPYLTRELAGAVWYPQDMQVQPALATALLLRRARDRGAALRLGTPVVGFTRGAGGRITEVRTPDGRIGVSTVVNATGVGAGTVAELAGSRLPIQPRRGFILVTAPVPPLVRAKVYDAAYVSNV